MAIDESGLSGQALKNAQAYNRAMKKAADSLEQQKKSFDTISTTLLGIDGGSFFRELSNDEYLAKTAELESKLKDLKVASSEMGNEMNASFKALLDGSAIGGLEEITDKLGLNAIEAEKFAKHFKKDEGIDFVSLSEDLGEFADDFIQKISNSDLDQSLVEPFVGAVEESKQLGVEMKKAEDAIKNVEKTTFSLASGLSAIGNNIAKSFSPQVFKDSILSYDAAIKEAQIETGIAYSKNSAGMSALASETAKFGLDIKGTTELMGELGKELRTSNFGVLSEATKDLAAMQKATGLAASDVAKLSKEYVMFGGNTKDLADDAAETMNQARAMGLNGKEIMEDMAKGMKKMRNMGFTGGEASLKRMVLEAKRLGLNVDDVFSMADKARNIEGAMEMAAELQLAGGSFAQIDPMQLLSAAREGPDAMMGIIDQMGSDIGAFNKDGEYKFDPVDRDRLKMVADATNLTIDEIQNKIAKTAMDNKKIDLLPDVNFDIADLKPEEREFLLNSMNKDGTLTMEAKAMGLDKLEGLTQDQIKAVMDQEAEKAANLQKQAEENMGLQESVKALKDSVINTLVPFFQPVIQHLTNFVQTLNQAGPFLKGVFGILMATMAVLFGPAKAYLNGIAQGRGFAIGSKGGGFLKGIKSIFTKGGGAAAGGTQQMMGPKPPAAPPGGKGQGWIAQMAAGIKAFGRVKMKDILKLGFALTVIGASVALFMLGIAATGSPDGAQLAAAAASMVIMAGGLWLATKILGKMSMKDVVMGALAMGIMGLALIPFAYAAQMMGEVDWLSVLAGVGIAILVVALLTALGVGMMFAMPFLLIGAGALAIAGIALLIAAASMAKAGELLMTALEPLSAITDVDWSGLISFSTALGSFGVGLIASGISLLAGAYFLMLAAPMLAIGAPMLISLTKADWSGLISLADGLRALGPALALFAIAGMSFFNPFALFGIGLMLSAISQLKTDMGSLGPNLQLGADGLERMAAGVAQLEAAVANMNMEKLQQLSEIMAEGGAEMGKFVAEINKAEDRKVTHVVQLQIDGKELQEIILKDTKHTT